MWLLVGMVNTKENLFSKIWKTMIDMRMTQNLRAINDGVQIYKVGWSLGVREFGL
jgi:hypothetical protein